VFVQIILFVSFLLIIITQAELKKVTLSALSCLVCVYTFILVVHRVIYEFHSSWNEVYYLILFRLLLYHCFMCVYFFVFSILSV